MRRGYQTDRWHWSHVTTKQRQAAWLRSLVLASGEPVPISWRPSAVGQSFLQEGADRERRSVVLTRRLLFLDRICRGVCPRCGEVGQLVNLGPVCSTHGPYDFLAGPMPPVSQEEWLALEGTEGWEAEEPDPGRRLPWEPAPPTSEERLAQYCAVLGLEMPDTFARRFPRGSRRSGQTTAMLLRALCDSPEPVIIMAHRLDYAQRLARELRRMGEACGVAVNATPAGPHGPEGRGLKVSKVHIDHHFWTAGLPERPPADKPQPPALWGHATSVTISIWGSILGDKAACRYEEAFNRIRAERGLPALPTAAVKGKP